jgi:hypothetical protein
MSRTAAMLDTHPAAPEAIDRDKLVACIDACVECAQTCTACADACLSEQNVSDLTTCIGNNLDCADLCQTTGRILSRSTGSDLGLHRLLLEACAAACRSCGDECDRHGRMGMDHCRVCAEACRQCEQACRELLAALG